MNTYTSFFRTTVGKKMLVGLSGLALAFFLLMHMSGNLLLFVGPEAYNTYSYKLTSTALIYVAEVGLILMFLIHVGLTISLTRQNRAARPIGYLAGTNTVKRTRFVAKTMILSGLLLFAFIVLHLKTFKYGPVTTVMYDNVEMRDLYSLVVERFQEPGYVAWYVFSMIIVGAHLSHGVSASLQSLSIAPANGALYKKIGWAFAAIVALGFMAQPLYLFFNGQ